MMRLLQADYGQKHLHLFFVIDVNKIHYYVPVDELQLEGCTLEWN